MHIFEAPTPRFWAKSRMATRLDRDFTHHRPPVTAITRKVTRTSIEKRP
jgi:hypothetical protein